MGRDKRNNSSNLLQYFYYYRPRRTTTTRKGSRSIRPRGSTPGPATTRPIANSKFCVLARLTDRRVPSPHLTYACTHPARPMTDAGATTVHATSQDAKTKEEYQQDSVIVPRHYLSGAAPSDALLGSLQGEAEPTL